MMNKFKESLKVSNETKQQIEEFLIKERRKIVADYKLTDKQKRDKIEILNDMKEDLNIPEEILRGRNEEQWEK